jgi:hypothetical protein
MTQTFGRQSGTLARDWIFVTRHAQIPDAYYKNRCTKDTISLE